jgi:hypothetical protein|tara:strand:+ start:125 stop:1186 length:1062 start_codon:yes stop_codon:yes gene_type:complete
MAAYTTIDDPSAFFQCTLYAGNNGTQTITHGGNSDLQANFIWGKARNDTAHSFIIDSIRGVAQRLRSSGDEKQATVSTGITAIGSDSFAVGNDGDFNDTGINYVTWNWKAGTALDNSAGTNGGSIATTGSINTTSGFGIVKYEGSGANATIYHGLGKIPRLIMTKNIDQDFHWSVYTFDINTKILRLNGTNAPATETAFQSTHPTATVQSLGDHNQNNGATDGSSDTHISYMFCDVQGFSKIGSYTGNSNADGEFIYTGFEPAFVMTKSTASTSNWEIKDNKRLGYNVIDTYIKANANAAEDTGVDSHAMDFLSNGFKHRGNNDEVNGTESYIYMAFAKSPFVTSGGVPNTAK